MNSLKKTARGAGILYVILDVLLIFSGMYVDPKLYVPGDAAATVSSILEFEWLFRLGFVSNLAGQIVSLFLVHTLYKLFRSVDKGQARLMVMLLALSVPVTFLNMLNQYAAVLLISGAGHLSAFNPAQLQTLAMIFLNLYDRGTIIAEIFWGLWLVPLGLLAYKSGFIQNPQHFRDSSQKCWGFCLSSAVLGICSISFRFSSFLPTAPFSRQLRMRLCLASCRSSFGF